MIVTIPLPLDRIARRARCDRVDGLCEPDHVVDQAMSELADQDRPREPIDVAALIAEAEASLAHGEGRAWSPELRWEIIKRAKEKIRLGIPPAPHLRP